MYEMMQQSVARIPIPHNQLAAFCQQHRIERLSLFGSVLRDDFGPESDVDFLVEFEPGQTPSLLTMAGLEQELAAMVGRKVDFRTPMDLSRYFRDDVMKGAVTQYARKQ